MAVAPDDATSGGQPDARPVLAAVSAAREALANSSPERIWALSDEEVSACVAALGQLSTSVDAHLVAVLAEAKRRSLGSGDGWGPVDWAQAKAPGLSTRKLLDIDTVAGVADELRMTDVVDAVAQGAAADQSDALPVEKAAQLVRFHRGVRGMADPDELESGTAILLDSARGHDGLSEKQLATALRHAADVMRPDRLVEHDADVRRAHRSLVKSPGPMGMNRYTMMLDEEGSAVLDAAIDVLAKPKPDQDTGEHDSRTPAARRADALLELVTRAVGAPEGVPRQAKTSLVVTIGLDVLQGRCRGGGLTMAGDLLTVETVRRLACDAQVIPMVLGSKGEVLDQGMPSGSSTVPRSVTCGCETGTAPSRAARNRPDGRTHTTSSIGSTTGRRTSGTPPCSAGRTTPWCTPTGLPGRSSTDPAGRSSCGTSRRAPTPPASRRGGRNASRSAAPRRLDHEPAPHPARRRRGIEPACLLVVSGRTGGSKRDVSG